ncbi:MAG: hypothetical protein U0Z44_14595 [Kouleothrix sp.]
MAAAAAALGQIALLYEPAERGLAWLARGRAGDAFDVLGRSGNRSHSIGARARCC